jgi:hypothetical protein
MIKVHPNPQANMSAKRTAKLAFASSEKVTAIMMPFPMRMTFVLPSRSEKKPPAAEPICYLPPTVVKSRLIKTGPGGYQREVYPEPLRDAVIKEAHQENIDKKPKEPFICPRLPELHRKIFFL